MSTNFLNSKWQKIYQCPICYSTENSEFVGYLPIKSYFFNSSQIDIGQNNIKLIECLRCGIYYKNLLPSQAYLKKIFKSHSDSIWNEKCRYTKEIGLINRFVSINNCDILDLGTSNGEFLYHLATRGRKSGLDIIEYPESYKAINGEFIDGFIDQEKLNWSRKKYDVVTAFDIFEHLYNPHKAFDNIRELLKLGGYLVIETGNIKSKWPTLYGPHNWWYVSLLEHHIFWSLKSLQYLAKRKGFEIIYNLSKRNKNRFYPPWWTISNDMLLSFFYVVYPRIFSLFKKISKPHIIQPRSPFSKDHIFIILRYTNN